MNSRLLCLFLGLPVSALAETTIRGSAEIGDSLQEAQALYESSNSLPRQDCDPVSDGRWICASYLNPLISDFLTGQSGRYTGEPTAVVADSLPAAKAIYAQASILPRIDCDPVGSQWVCASFNNPTLADVNAGNINRVANQNAPSADSTAEQTSAELERPIVSTTSLTLNNALIPSNSLFAPGDLLSLNYDSCPDADDMHAATSGKMVLDFYELQLGVDYIVTNGTCGDLRPRNDFIVNSPVLFNQLYGDQWNDAYYQEDYSISVVAQLYKERLESGAKVWVLDGGPMDFTTRVLAYMTGVGTSADLKNITVVQHSHGWNEQNTDPSNMAYLKSQATYLTIDNGNYGGNNTPQLNHNNAYLHTPSVDQSLVQRLLSNEHYGQDWRVAFSLLDAGSRLDGSDTVELLWVMGVDSSQVESWHDFVDQYLPEY